MAIPREIVEQILQTARIEEVVSEFVTLKKRGANLIGCCPFHNEKTPSFNVNPARNLNKKDVKSIAVELYNEKAKERLPRLIIRRNDVLLNYLTNTKGIVSKRIKINSMNEAQMREYKKDTRYEVHINMDDDATEAEPSREIEK